MAKEDKIKQGDIGNTEIRFHVIGHYGSIATAQAIEKTNDHLAELKEKNPGEYEKFKLSEIEDRSNNIYEFKEGDRIKCRITHNAEGDISAAFYTNDPKYFDLALCYIENCKSQRAQLSGGLGEPHEFQSTLFSITAGVDADPDAILTLYENSKLARLEKYGVIIPDPKVVALFGEETSDKFKEYMRINKMTPEEIDSKRIAREEKRLTALEQTKITPSKSETIIKWE